MYRILWLLLFPVLPSCNVKWCTHLEMEPSSPCPMHYEQFQLSCSETDFDSELYGYRQGSEGVTVIDLPFSN
ncbi:MAG: hypothetical protein PVF17_00615 [Ignavibacteria bacterium]